MYRRKPVFRQVILRPRLSVGFAFTKARNAHPHAAEEKQA
jgi:hypothetical protein